jgi:hypothetical protein
VFAVDTARAEDSRLPSFNNELAGDVEPRYARLVRARVNVMITMIIALVACQAEHSPTVSFAPTLAPTPAVSPEAEASPEAEPTPEDELFGFTTKPEPPSSPPDPLTLCDSSWWALTLPVPSEDGPHARLHVRDNPGHSYRRGEPEPLCVRWGDGPWELAEPGMLKIAADPTRLQRWLIGKYPILLHVPPDDEIAVRFHPCMNWQFRGVRFDPDRQEDPKSCCGHEGCLAGYERRESFDDPLCPDTLELNEMTRCTKLAVVQIVDDRTRQKRVRPIGEGNLPEELYTEILDEGGLPVERIKPGTALWQSTDACVRQRAFTATDSVGLILGIGERWRIWVGDDDKLTGELIVQP